jgi:type IV secretion system protein TrbB
MQDNHERIQEKFKRELGEKLFAALQDETVIEMMLNEDGKVWLDTLKGMYYFTTMPAMKARNFIRTVASIASIEVHRESPDISAELRLIMEGEMKIFRFQGLMPPLVSSPIFSIRKPASRVFTLHEYVSANILNTNQLQVIAKAVRERKNILVVGGTGSGKTTLCNAVLQEISEQFPNDRTAIIEDTLELQCSVENKIHLRTSDNRTMNDLLRYCMRLRPDRIIIGEVRGKEAHSLIKAWNTGHPGGLSTIHANDALRGLMRVAQLVEEAGVPANPDAIAEAINLVIYITRDGSSIAGRKVTEILEIQGYDPTHQRYVSLSFPVHEKSLMKIHSVAL